MLWFTFKKSLTGANLPKRTIQLALMMLALTLLAQPLEATPPLEGTTTEFVASDIATSADGAYSVYAADMDGDGDMDILSASANDNTIAWYENNGAANPTWTASDIATTAAFAWSVFAADMDNDGDMDILSASYVDNTIAWYENNGAADPTWTASDIATTADGATSVFAADMDNDGDMDILSASFNDNTIAWYENDGAANPTWVASDIATTAAGATSVFAADMDNDGDLDILSASFTDDTIAWYENNGAADPTWTASDIATSADGVYTVYAADMDNDGDMDILSASALDDTIAWYENNGASDPSWTASDIALSADGARSVYAADMDNDGDLDILSASFNDNTIAWYENNGAANPTWTASDIATTAANATSVFAADMDGDGDMDILSASYIDDTIAWYENDLVHQNAPFDSGVNITTSPNQPRPVVAADMDKDGDLDIVSASFNDDTIAWYENDGAANPTWTASNIANTANGATSVFVADMDNDGDMDILSSSFIDDTIAWYENDGAVDPTFTASNIFTTADGAASVFAADMDGDGDMDILSASQNDGTIAWYENDGAVNPTWTHIVIATSANGARSIFAADMDNDGDMDILSASREDDTIAWYENNGAANPTFTASDIATSADGAASVFAADMDSDGDMDILSASEFDDTIAWYENDGAANPAWAASDIVTTADGAFTVFAADMDNDGDMDILSASLNDNTIAWYENDGATDPTFTASDITTTATGAFFVSAADMDNDGDMDVLSTASSANTIAWHENEGGSAGFVVTDTSINSGFIADGAEDDVMRVVFTHNGIAADRDIELNYWNIDLLAADCTTALTSAAVNTNLAALRVRLDDGDGTFETDGSDVPVGSVTAGSFSLDGNGTQQVTFTNNDVNVQVDFDVTPTKTYWLSLEAPVDQGQLGICVRLDPDADMLVDGKTPDFSVSIQDSDPTTTTNTPTAVSLQFVGAPATTNGMVIAILTFGTLLLTLGALWVRRRTG